MHTSRSQPATTPRRHVVITGTGRTGTTFLVELLTHLGLDTGFSAEDVGSRKDGASRAGLEHDIRRDGCPRVVKSPWFCDHAEDVLARSDIVVEHVLVPIRELSAAAESRRRVTEAHASRLPLRKRLVHAFRPRKTPGGLWHTRSRRPGRQEEVLLRQLYRLLLAVADSRVPVTLLRYPRITRDARYLYEKLRGVLDGCSFERLEAAFRRTVRPELVHSFNARDR